MAEVEQTSPSEAEKAKEAEAIGAEAPPAVVEAEPVGPMPMDVEIAPPPYQKEAEEQQKCPLSYVDFIPGIVAMSDCPEFQKFHTLVDQANEWLKENPHLRPINCETVERKVEDVTGYRNKFEMVDMQIMGHTELTFDQKNFYVKGLRIWVTSRDDEDLDKPACQIGYIDAAPEKGGKGDDRKQYPSFSNMGSCIAKLNSKTRAGLPGRVMSVQAVELRVGNSYFSDSQIDSEETLQVTEPKNIQMHYFFVRLYYIAGNTTKPDIRYKDFQPKCTARVPKAADKNTDPKFEKMSSLHKNVHDWLEQNPNLDLINIQTVNTRNMSWSWIDREGWPRYDPEAMDREQAESNRFDRILRVLRVFYVAKPIKPGEEQPEKLNLLMETFPPLSTGRTFEGLKMTTQRMQGYVKSNPGNEVKCCETVIFDYKAGANHMSECDLTFTRIEKAKSLYFFYAIRIYFNRKAYVYGGGYGTPAHAGQAQQMQRPPQQQKSSTCSLL